MKRSWLWTRDDRNKQVNIARASHTSQDAKLAQVKSVLAIQATSGVVLGVVAAILTPCLIGVPCIWLTEQAEKLIEIEIPSRLVTLGWLLPTMACWFLVWRRLVMPSQAAAARSYWLLWGCCASCGYPLGERQQESDGCTLCPECGAAWKLNAAQSK